MPSAPPSKTAYPPASTRLVGGCARAAALSRGAAAIRSPCAWHQSLVRDPADPASTAPTGGGILYARDGWCHEEVASSEAEPKHRWRDYRTRSGARPVKVFIEALTDEEAAAVVAAMNEVAQRGRSAARHLRGEIYEVRAQATTRSFRVLFSAEGRGKHVLLSLSAFEKRTQKTPPSELELAEARLRDWRSRARTKRASKP